MSATEIIEAIKKLPNEEQQKVAAFINEMKNTNVTKSETGVTDEFERVVDKIFATNNELFRKLSQ